MLVLTRKESQRILVGDNITITIVRVDGNRVRIGIEAPPEVAIHRSEIAESDLKTQAKPQLVGC